jgi:hypothetical protein
MRPDAQVVNSLRIVARPRINGDVSEILANDIEEFCDYLEQHGGMATTPKLLRSSPLFRIPQKIEGIAGSDQPAVNKGVHSLLSNRTSQKPRSRERMRELL